MTDTQKKKFGRFYTIKNPFFHKEFLSWANIINLKDTTILEPFAGSNNIIKMLKEADLCNTFESFDILPKNHNVKKRDTIYNFPKGYTVCITNPPWLYKSRARRMGLDFPKTDWDNLYKCCLELALNNCPYVAMLIPASFINSNQFYKRLKSVIFIHEKIFVDTENPVCLALFDNKATKDTKVFLDDVYIGNLTNLKKYIPNKEADVIFNSPNGELGLICVDNTKEASIKFCKGIELGNKPITNASRSITRISGIGDITNKKLKKLNQNFMEFRNNTSDIFLTPFKGLRKDGFYRRRLDYTLARKFIGGIL